MARVGPLARRIRRPERHNRMMRWAVDEVWQTGHRPKSREIQSKTRRREWISSS